MTKDLIEQARDYTYQGDSWQLQQRLADLIEAQQKRIHELEAELMGERCVSFRNQVAEQKSWIASLEQHAKDADRIYKELETELAAAQAQIKVLREALENCRLFAARRRAEEWATHILRFCESGGSVANPLRQDDSALRELLKAERERCAKVADEWKTAIHDPRYQCDCAKAILAMEDK